MDLRYTFLDQNGEMVECGVGEADEIAELAAQFMVLHGSDPDEDGREAAPGTIIFEPVQETPTLLRRLQSALQWLLDDMTDAGEDENPETGEVFDSVDNARAALAESQLQIPPAEGKGTDG